MKRTPVDSTAIASIGYDAAEELLEIEFTTGGIYRYAEVEYEVYSDLIEAESKGRAFHALIDGAYVYWRVR